VAKQQQQPVFMDGFQSIQMSLKINGARLRTKFHIISPVKTKFTIPETLISFGVQSIFTNSFQWVLFLFISELSNDIRITKFTQMFEMKTRFSQSN
jgi:hypothetical protein